MTARWCAVGKKEFYFYKKYESELAGLKYKPPFWAARLSTASSVVKSFVCTENPKKTAGKGPKRSRAGHGQGHRDLGLSSWMT